MMELAASHGGNYDDDGDDDQACGSGEPWCEYTGGHDAFRVSSMAIAPCELGRKPMLFAVEPVLQRTQCWSLKGCPEMWNVVWHLFHGLAATGVEELDCCEHYRDRGRNGDILSLQLVSSVPGFLSCL